MWQQGNIYLPVVYSEFPLLGQSQPIPNWMSSLEPMKILKSQTAGYKASCMKTHLLWAGYPCCLVLQIQDQLMWDWTDVSNPRWMPLNMMVCSTWSFTIPAPQSCASIPPKWTGFTVKFTDACDDKCMVPPPILLTFESCREVGRDDAQLAPIWTRQLNQSQAGL